MRAPAIAIQRSREKADVPVVMTCRSTFALRYAIVFAIYSLVATSAFAQPISAIGDGALVSVRGPSHFISAFNQSLTTSKSFGMQVRDLAPGIKFIDTKTRRALTLRTSSLQTEMPYSRKNNPCKRARMRKILASLGVRARCEPNWIVRASVTPDDPDYSQQYASSFLSLPAAWELTTGSEDLLVVVIDTGVQFTHPDLATNMWVNPYEIAGNGIDDDNNGFIDDIHGVNVRDGTGNPNDDNGHGTHCAGILGARGNNTIGIAGVAWRTKIVGAKFLSSTSSGTIAGAIAAINYSRTLKLAGHNVVATNNSWGGGSFSPSLYSAIQQSINAGILFIAAAGNSARNSDVTPAYPGSYDLDGILSVASTNDTGALSDFSNFGLTTVDIAAPGSEIHSCMMGSTYVKMSGTSMAAPQVSGIALLVQSICRGSLSVAQVKQTILSSGVFNSALSGRVATGAIANAAGAVTAANNFCNPTPTPTPTATPTETPTATPTREPAPEPPPPTSTPEVNSGSSSGIEIRLSPNSALEPSMQLKIQVSYSGPAKSASLQLVGNDSTRRSHSCEPVRVKLADGMKRLSMQLPGAIRHFRTITITASAGRKNARDRVSIARPIRTRSLQQAQRLFAQLCSALEQATD